MAKVSFLKTYLGWIAFAYDNSKLLANSIPFQNKYSALEFLKKVLLKRKILNYEFSFNRFISNEINSAILGNDYSIELSFENLSNFCIKVLKIVMKIPRGKVISYKTIAELINIKAYRAIGRALSKNPFPIIIPCHRVIKHNGSLGNYIGGKKLKELLLKNEGVEILNGKVMEKYLLLLNELIYHF
ncbi:MAG: methylated-DNA--[protein]-cysteine S-methyltransferase [Candidatus Methanomethylicaceae archaeon]|nr:methylated-DNA--[protein]-cysteine S-methyltransferase [Candidatus Verstraetearchaeota archaeon]